MIVRVPRPAHAWASRRRCAASQARSRSTRRRSASTDELVDAHARHDRAPRPRRRRRPGSPTTAASVSASGGSRSSTSPTRRCSRCPTRTAPSALVFNGEIYNHAEIRPRARAARPRVPHRPLRHRGDRPRASRSGASTCVAPLARHVRLRGLGRPRRASSGSCATASASSRSTGALHHGRLALRLRDQGAARRIREQERAVDEEALYHYLSFLTTPAPQTLFRGIRKLAGGTWLRVDRERRHPRASATGTRGTRSSRSTGVSEDEIAERVLDELRTSVRLRKVSDVPVGVFLSGGIDSSTNAALFSEGESRPIKTFSIGYDGDYATLHERVRLRAADGRARRRRAPRAQADAVDDLIDFLPEMVRLQDEPIADPVCVPVYYVSKLARDNGVIVAQVGEGADELFWGYPSWKTLLGAAALRRPAGPARPEARRRRGRAAGRQGSAGARSSTCAAARWASRSSGAARSRSPRRRSSGCCRRGCARELGGLTSWDAIEPIRRRFEAKALGGVRISTG